jgi:hypothetical protein
MAYLSKSFTADSLKDRNGIQVFVSRFDPLKEPPILGTVVSRNTTQIKVTFQQSFDLKEGPWRFASIRSALVNI